jgi:hypothetical protein
MSSVSASDCTMFCASHLLGFPQPNMWKVLHHDHLKVKPYNKLQFMPAATDCDEGKSKATCVHVLA